MSAKAVVAAAMPGDAERARRAVELNIFSASEELSRPLDAGLVHKGGVPPEHRITWENVAVRLVPIRSRAAAMNFRPIFSFSIQRFDYDAASRRLLVHYFDGRQAIYVDVPPLVVAVLRASSHPEIELRRYAKEDRAVA
jgi:hypothetical protein